MKLIGCTLEVLGFRSIVRIVEINREGMMLTRVYTQAGDNSHGLAGCSMPSTKDLVTEAVAILQNETEVNSESLVHLETKDLCQTQVTLRSGYADFLLYVIGRLANVLKQRFTKRGGKLFVCIHDIKRKEDRVYFPTSFDSRSLNCYVGISLRVILCLSGSQSENDSEYESLFCMHNEDSCFSSMIMDELKKRGIILKTDRHLERKLGVVYTLFFPKDVHTLQ